MSGQFFAAVRQYLTNLGPHLTLAPLSKGWVLSLMVKRHVSIIPSHPGEILREEILPSISMSKSAVATALGISRQTLYDILNERQPVTAEMAVRFGKLFGNGANFWVSLQRNHELALVERAVDVSGTPTLRTGAG